MHRRPAFYASLGLAGILILYYLYFFRLSGAGLIGPDEPRYASIARDMARSGDWITPRLWGAPWFEKPVLTYWMTGFGFRLGLGEELAPRLPVALLSVGFLGFFFWALRREFGPRPAFFSTVILATSAGWLAYSQVGVTDLPMSAAFSAAMLLALGWMRCGGRRELPFIGALLGLAVLAKGLVPLVLALPLAYAAGRRVFDLLHPRLVAPFLAVAAPWYLLCYFRNGAPFLREFFWEHHITRVTSEALQHVQPFWFYLPVLAAAVFPWTPALALLFRPSLYGKRSRRFLLLWVLFGLLFFSVSVNKLPGYLLPLLPAAAALMGLGLAEVRRAGWVLAASALLLLLIPPLIYVLPQALASGLSRARWPAFQPVWLAPALLAGAVWALEARGRRVLAAGLLAGGVTAGVVALKVRALPQIDRIATARPIWQEIAAEADRVCISRLHRNLRYGLNYYSVTPLPDCEVEPRPVRLSRMR